MKEILTDQRPCYNLNNSYNTGNFYKGCLQRGQTLESKESVVVIGDVMPGARVISKGNVVVIGELKGSVYAGISGNTNAYVVAMNMCPEKIRIAETTGKPESGRSMIDIDMPRIAFLEGKYIYIHNLLEYNWNRLREENSWEK